MQRPRPRWKVRLMPFVERGDECRAEQRDCGPLQAPARAETRKGRTPGAEKKNTKREVAHDVSRLSQYRVPQREPLRIQTEKKMKYRVQEPPSMLCRAEVRRFDGDDRQPDGGREPHSKDSLGGRVQLPIIATRLGA